MHTHALTPAGLQTGPGQCDPRGLAALGYVPQASTHTPHTDTHTHPPCPSRAQTGPGQYDPKGLAALDYVLDSASRHGIQLILSFIDNWKYYNGVAQVCVCVWVNE